MTKLTVSKHWRRPVGRWDQAWIPPEPLHHVTIIQLEETASTHIAVLIIFPVNLQIITVTRTLPCGGEGSSMKWRLEIRCKWQKYTWVWSATDARPAYWAMRWRSFKFSQIFCTSNKQQHLRLNSPTVTHRPQAQFTELFTHVSHSPICNKIIKQNKITENWLSAAVSVILL